MDPRPTSRPSGIEGDDPEKNPLSIGNVVMQEFQVISNDESPLAEYFTWVGGLYYLKGKSGVADIKFFVAGLDDLLAGGVLGVTPFDVPLLDELHNALIRLNLPQVGAIPQTGGTVKTDSWAAYAQGT